ncbi:MAG: hypothetical protein AAGF45_09965 [Pseudomonadota bacterium]
MGAEVILSREATGEVLASGHEAVNAALKGTGVWVAPRPLDDEPPEMLALLQKTVLTEEENARVKAHFLLSREKCLDIIAAAGRTPQVPGGGSMEAFCETLEVPYPQLWVIEKGRDMSGFLHYHRNLGEDGTGSDDVGQQLSGTLMRYRYDLFGGVVLTMNCTDDAGWLFTFSGILPHGGMLHETSIGSKTLVQVLGPERFWVRKAA